jgi:hypothetical protein
MLHCTVPAAVEIARGSYWPRVRARCTAPAHRRVAVATQLPAGNGTGRNVRTSPELVAIGVVGATLCLSPVTSGLCLTAAGGARRRGICTDEWPATEETTIDDHGAGIRTPLWRSRTIGRIGTTHLGSLGGIRSLGRTANRAKAWVTVEITRARFARITHVIATDHRLLGRSGRGMQGTAPRITSLVTIDAKIRSRRFFYRTVFIHGDIGPYTIRYVGIATKRLRNATGIARGTALIAAGL